MSFLKKTPKRDDYDAYLSKIERNVDEEIRSYRDFISRTMFPTARLPQIITEMRPQLFWKLPEHEDFLTVNLGNATVQVPMEITYPASNYSEHSDRLERFRRRIEDKLSGQGQPPLPFGISLRQNSPLALAADGMDTPHFLECVNAVLMDIAAFQSAEEMALCVISNRDELQWTRLLPQIQFGTRRLIYNNTEPESALTPLLKEAFDNTSRHLVAVVDVDFAAQYASLFYSMFNSSNLPDHVSCIFFSSCGIIPTRARSEVWYQAAVPSLTCKYEGRHIQCGALSSMECTSLARFLFNSELVDSHREEVSEIPTFLTFFQMLRIRRAGDLPPQYPVSQLVHIQDDFPVRVGTGIGGRDIILNLSNANDGNHCLVTGTNGSGKSEFIQNYLLSACSFYPPDYLSFVVIDFKGRSMSEKVSSLPHCVGEFYNSSSQMSAHDVSRIAFLLEAELYARQKIMAEFHDKTGSSNLTDYHHMYAQGGVTAPLPRLLIVIDEVAVFFKNDPQAREYITHIATAGRSVGMILLLSTQTPSTVSNSQLTSNINVYVRFDEGTDHHDGDHIKGRAVINSLQKTDCLCQCALADTPVPSGIPLSFLTSSGITRRMSSPHSLSQLEAIRTQITDRYIGWTDTPHILTHPLEGQYSLRELLDYCDESYPSGSVFPFALVDNLHDRRYDLFDFVPGEYHLALYGPPNSGKTTAVRSILLSLLRPQGLGAQQLSVYIAADKAAEYQQFRDYPQVGGIVSPSDLFYLLLFLLQECNRREKNAAGHTPRIVAVLDGCMKTIIADPELLAMFQSIAPRAVSCGISIIAALFEPPRVQNFSALFENFLLFHTPPDTFTLSLDNKKDASGSSFGHKHAIHDIPNLPGRCLSAAPNRNSWELQIALPDSGMAESACFWRAHTPAGLPSGRLPVMPAQPGPVSIAPNIRRLPVGLYRQLTPAVWDMSRFRSYLISYFETGEMLPFLFYMIQALLAANYNLVLVDNKQHALSPLGLLVSRYFTPDQGEELLAFLQDYPHQQRRPTVLVMLDHAQSLFPRNTADEKLIGRIVTLLQSSAAPPLYALFAQSNPYMFQTHMSIHHLAEILESQGPMMLIGHSPDDHYALTRQNTPGAYGSTQLPAFVRQTPGWGCEVQPGGKRQYVKLYKEVSQ